MNSKQGKYKENYKEAYYNKIPENCEKDKNFTSSYMIYQETGITVDYIRNSASQKTSRDILKIQKERKTTYCVNQEFKSSNNILQKLK